MSCIVDGFLPSEPQGKPTLVETAWWTQETEPNVCPGGLCQGGQTHSLGVGKETGRAIMGASRCSAVLGSLLVQAWKVGGLDDGFSGRAGICGG